MGFSHPGQRRSNAWVGCKLLGGTSQDLAITAEFDDEHGLAITLRSLSRLWQASRDTGLPHAIASIMQTTPEDVEKLLSSLLSAEA